MWWWCFSPQVRFNSCDPMDSSQPGSFIHRIAQARILEWAAISFSRGSSWPGDLLDPSYLHCRQSPASQVDSFFFPHRWILYQLCYQRSPFNVEESKIYIEEITTQGRVTFLPFLVVSDNKWILKVYISLCIFMIIDFLYLMWLKYGIEYNTDLKEVQP